MTNNFSFTQVICYFPMSPTQLRMIIWRTWSPFSSFLRDTTRFHRPTRPWKTSRRPSSSPTPQAHSPRASWERAPAAPPVSHSLWCRTTLEEVHLDFLEEKWRLGHRTGPSWDGSTRWTMKSPPTSFALSSWWSTKVLVQLLRPISI